MAEALSICSFVFSLLALAGTLYAVVEVLAGKRTTHRVVQVPVPQTSYEYDLPKEVLDRMPQPAETPTATEYTRAQSMSVEDFYRSIGEE